MTQPKAYSFGYGSLVNRDTHAFRELYQARVQGWQRRWCHWVEAPFGTCTTLTVVAKNGAQMSGLIMGTPLADHTNLNAREKGYDRIMIDASAISHGGPAGIEVELYQSRTPLKGTENAPILQSYADTVMQGFEREFGPQGLTDFITETDGWDTPILKDRSVPIYPRTTPLPAKDAARYDAILADIGVRYIEPA